MSKGSGIQIEVNQTGGPRVVEASDGGMSISIPITIKRRSGRRLITLPDGINQDPRPWDTEPTSLQLALARGHRWLQMLDSGEASSLREIAEKEGVNNSYVSRMVNLTLLAPDIVAAILDDQLPQHLSLFDVAVDPSRIWTSQRKRIGIVLKKMSLERSFAYPDLI